MFWLTVIAVAFLVLLTCVVVLARSSTARWEREKRAARAPRRDAAGHGRLDRPATGRAPLARTRPAVYAVAVLRVLGDRRRSRAAARLQVPSRRGLVTRAVRGLRFVASHGVVPMEHPGALPVGQPSEVRAGESPDPGGEPSAVPTPSSLEETVVLSGGLRGRAAGQRTRRVTRGSPGRFPRRLAARLVQRHADEGAEQAPPPAGAASGTSAQGA